MIDLDERFDESRVVRCTRCLYPNTKPDLHFDEKGVCSACRAFDKRKLTNWALREAEFHEVLKSGKNDSGYDCIVPSSGGKDSHWQVLKLIALGARPLVVTATTCHLTETGRRNIDNLARYATTIEVTPNRTARKKLNRLGLQLVGDISWPEHVAIFTTPFNVACQLGIPLIFYGECPQEAYGGPPGTEDARQMTARWVSEFGGFNGLRPADMVGKEGLTAADMRDYQPPPDEAVRRVGVRAYFLGQFFEWISSRNAQVAVDHGMEAGRPGPANHWSHENLDNAQTGLHDYFMYRKFGFGRACAQLSMDIRWGVRDRRDAAEKVLRYLDGRFPAVYGGVTARDALADIGVTMDELCRLVARFTNRDLWPSLDA